MINFDTSTLPAVPAGFDGQLIYSQQPRKCFAYLNLQLARWIIVATDIENDQTKYFGLLLIQNQTLLEYINEMDWNYLLLVDCRNIYLKCNVDERQIYISFDDISYLSLNGSYVSSLRLNIQIPSHIIIPHSNSFEFDRVTKKFK